MKKKKCNKYIFSFSNNSYNLGILAFCWKHCDQRRCIAIAIVVIVANGDFFR